MKNQVKSGYNKIAQAYQAGRDQFKNDKILKKLEKMLRPKSTVLDLGCGSGIPIAEFFIAHKHAVIGIDISDEQIKLAKQNVPKAKFLVRDMQQLSNKEFAVDAVVSFYAIFHIQREEHAGLLQKINSFLPVGGLLLITMGASAWQGSEDFFGVKMHWSHYGKNKNSQLVKKAGFQILFDEIDETGGEKHQVILARKVK